MQIGASASAWGADGEYATGALAAEVHLNQQLGLAVRRKYQVEDRYLSVNDNFFVIDRSQ